MPADIGIFLHVQDFLARFVPTKRPREIYFLRNDSEVCSAFQSLKRTKLSKARCLICKDLRLLVGWSVGRSCYPLVVSFWEFEYTHLRDSLWFVVKLLHVSPYRRFLSFFFYTHKPPSLSHYTSVSHTTTTRNFLPGRVGDQPTDRRDLR